VIIHVSNSDESEKSRVVGYLRSLQDRMKYELDIGLVKCFTLGYRYKLLLIFYFLGLQTEILILSEISLSAWAFIGQN